jgi:uncharacterized iron-regulated membrane protein
MSDEFELWMTVAILLACLAAIGTLSWLERRPRTSLTPRLLPTTPLLLAAGFIGLLALVHLVNIFGIHTGR